VHVAAWRTSKNKYSRQDAKIAKFYIIDKKSFSISFLAIFASWREQNTVFMNENVNGN
jgi:hypothetical protein